MNDINRVTTVDSLINQAIYHICDSGLYPTGHFNQLLDEPTEFGEPAGGFLQDAYCAIKTSDLTLCVHKLIEVRKFLLKPVEISGNGSRVEKLKLQIAVVIRDMTPAIDAAILLLSDHATVTPDENAKGSDDVDSRFTAIEEKLAKLFSIVNAH